MQSLKSISVDGNVEEGDQNGGDDPPNDKDWRKRPVWIRTRNCITEAG